MESQLVKNGQVDCWIKNLSRFISEDSQGALELPLNDQELFNQYLLRFVKEDSLGIEAFRTQKLGFIDEDDSVSETKSALQYMEISFLSIGATDATRQQK